MTTPPTRTSGRRKAGYALLGVVATLVVGVGVAYAVDTNSRGDNTRRNIEVAGVAVGDLSPLQLGTALEGVAADLGGADVSITIEDDTTTANAASIGVTMDVEATAAAVSSVDDDVPTVLRPLDWLGSLLSTTTVAPVMVVDGAVLAESPVAAFARRTESEPVEPDLRAEGASMVVVPGRDGTIVTLDAVEAAVGSALADYDGGPISATVVPKPSSPQVSDADAETLAFLTTVALAEPVEAKVGSTSTMVPPEALAQWLETRVDGNELKLRVKPKAAVAGLNELDPNLGTPEVPVAFAVVDGEVTFSGGTPGTMCCAPRSTQRLLDAMYSDDRVAVLRDKPRPLERGPQWAESLGIVEPIGTFTTNYPAGQDRAINIVRIAEILRGTVIEPGTTFSVNDSTGPRGIEQGFVEGGIIVNGRLTTGVGGGISQFATTLFNAAFFAGLDIPDYMMHTLYISRYPYGREATLAYGAVDLKITNNTPYGVLLWTESTPDSITVTLYSTPWVTGEQTGQSQAPAGNCTRVTTERTRTWLADGRTETDQFFASYQPREGVLC